MPLFLEHPYKYKLSVTVADRLATTEQRNKSQFGDINYAPGYCIRDDSIQSSYVAAPVVEFNFVQDFPHSALPH